MIDVDNDDIRALRKRAENEDLIQACDRALQGSHKDRQLCALIIETDEALGVA